MKARRITPTVAPQVPPPVAGRATDSASDAPYDVWRKYDAVRRPSTGPPGKEQYTEQYNRVVDELPDLV